MRLDQELITTLTNQAADLRRKNGLEMTEAVSKVLQQNKISNKAYFSAVCSALGNRGGKTKKARRRSIQSSINGIQKKLDRQIREAEEMARQRNDHLLPDP